MLQARVEVRGLDIHYRQWGEAEGPPLVLAHGLPDGSFVWGPLAEGVADLRRVIAPDLPGFGGSPAPRDFDYTVRSLSDVFDGFLEALSLDRFDLGVHDIAGGYAIPVAGRRAASVGRLVAFNTNVFTGWKWHRLAELIRRPIVGRLAMARSPRRVLERFLRPIFIDEPPAWYVDEVWKGWRSGSVRRAMRRFYRANEESSWRPAEEALPALRGKPALVVWGDRDRFVSPRFASRMAGGLGAQLVRVDAGHFPMLERTEEVLAAVRPFLAGEHGSEGQG